MSTPTSNTTYPVRLITVAINRAATDVYDYASNPENFPKWVEFVDTVAKHGDHWIAKTNLGEIEITFTPRNNFGVIDHDVKLPNGDVVTNPMRVVPNNQGCEFTFTLFWMPGRSEAEFNEDAAAVHADLQNLKRIMESR